MGGDPLQPSLHEDMCKMNGEGGRVFVLKKKHPARLCSSVEFLLHCFQTVRTEESSYRPAYLPYLLHQHVSGAPLSQPST